MKQKNLSHEVTFFLILLTGFLISGFTSMDDSELNIIPKPWKSKISKGVFRFEKSTRILVEENNPEAQNVAKYLAERIEKVSGCKLEISETNKTKVVPGAILLTSSGVDPELGDEGYIFNSDAKGVVINGNPAGLFYGVQTLFQLLPPQIYNVDSVQIDLDWSIPAVTIKDKPRFPWRGMHLDVGRHLFPVDFIKKYIDYLAMHKMNTFHWHLTEDQGWRIEIKKYPLLTEVGAFRKGSVIKRTGNLQIIDDKPYGGYYTQEEIRDVVQYAKERFITVVPEIEMPGHCMAALAAYPNLSCTGGPFDVRIKWGVEKNVYCIGNEDVFNFLQDVLSEVIELFPSKYIHIGGDEAPKDRWEKCPKCQQRIKDEGLKDEHELQSYFIQRIEKFLNSKGRQIIGWDEILEGGLAPNAAVMSWRGIEGGIAAAQQEHNVVMSPSTHCYFNEPQGDLFQEPAPSGKSLSLAKVYEFEPVPAELSLEQAHYILGAQGNVWTEYMETPADVEYMALPRMSALAEVVWSAKKQRNLENFLKRMSFHYLRLDETGANYHHPSLSGFYQKNIFINEKNVTIRKQRHYSEVRFTLDGSDPTKESTLYAAPIRITETTVLKAREFLPNGHVSKIYQGQFFKQEPIESTPVENVKNGLFFDYFEFDQPIDSAAELKNLKPKASGFIDHITYPYEKFPEYFGLLFKGFVKIQSDGVYTFTLLSNDGSRLYIDDQLVIDNDGWHGAQEMYGQIALKAGFHPIQVAYFQVGGGKALKAFIEGPGLQKQEIADSILWHNLISK